MSVNLGDIDPVSALIGALGVIIAVVVPFVYHRLTGYRVRARLSVAVHCGSHLLDEVSAVNLQAINPHLPHEVVQVVVVNVANSGRSPVTVSGLCIQNARPIRQKLLQKLRIRPGFVLPWIPGRAMTDAQLPLRLSEHDQETLVYPREPVEFAAAAWCVLLKRHRTRARAVLVLGNQRKIRTNKIWLPLTPVTLPEP